jgi:glutathione-independent formaldehyde dehydrogenase
MAAMSATIRGASQIFVVALQPHRLALAERIGATAVSVADGNPSRLRTTFGIGLTIGRDCAR